MSKSENRENRDESNVTITGDSYVNVKGDIVGGNKVINILFSPTGWVLLVIAVIATGAASIWGFTLLPHDPEPMTGLFNIAIAEFGVVDEQGNVSTWQDGRALKESIANRMKDEFATIPILKPIVQIRYENIGIVQGKTETERAKSAYQIADKLNAQLLIYGNLEAKSDGQVFQPEFFVQDLKDAEELLGPNRIGSPLNTGASTPGVAQNIELSEALSARTKALTFVSIGLAYLSLHKPDNAVSLFTDAQKVEGWDDEDGKEIIYLLLGKALLERKKSGDFELARAAFSQALRLNPEFARAYLGLGNTFYAEFDASDRKDPTNLDLAQAQYERAEIAQDRPESAFITAKVHVNLGNIYLIRAQMGQPEKYAQAQVEFQYVLNPYEHGQTELKPFAALAYFGVGVIAERQQKNYAQATKLYQKALDLGNDNTELRALAEKQLEIVQSRLTPTP